ncbi:MAG: hypothetical protein K2N87_10680 [Eubacterium sp.]|nr:hypothetical protein [Eubacterium sp.]
MNRKKTGLVGLLCVLFLCLVQKSTVYAASPSLSASADTGSVAQGEYVNINVELGNNPSISTLGAALAYDSSVLKYDSSTWNSNFSGSDMQMASDTGSEVNLSVVCDDSYEADGTVVTVRFQAVKDSDSVPVTLALRDMADAELEQVSDCTVASAVQVPQTAKPVKEPTQDPIKETDESSPVDLQDPQQAADISIVDEEINPETPSEDVPSDAASGAAQQTANAADSTQAASAAGGTQAAVSPQAKASRVDANYQTGIGLGSDALLIGAAVFGILALVLALRHRREENHE